MGCILEVAVLLITTLNDMKLIVIAIFEIFDLIWLCSFAYQQ